MIVYKLFLFCLLLLFSSLSYADQGISSTEIEARVAELSALRVKSVSGHFMVIGTNRVESFALGNWCENAVRQVEHVTGLAVPFNDRRIVLIVDEDNRDALGGAVVRYSLNGLKHTSRVYLENYDVAYERRGRQAICCAILAGYVDGFQESLLSLPPWLWKGMEQNILFDVRSRNMEQVLADWRSGKLMSARDIVGNGERNEPDLRAKAVESWDKLAAYSVFVRWISSRPNRKDVFRTIFSDAGYITVSGLESLVVDSDSELSLDESWERWLLKQGRVVRSCAPLSTRVIEQIRSELLLYPGTYGIHLSGEIPQGSSFVKLITFRDAEWVSQYVNRKRGRLNLIAAGHSEELVQVVSLFDDFLAGLKKETADVLLLKQLRDANRSLNRLAERVKENGGILNNGGK